MDPDPGRQIFSKFNVFKQLKNVQILRLFLLLNHLEIRMFLKSLIS